jgi:hypothetical protein
MGGMIEITAQYSLSTFLIFYNSSIGAGLIMILLSPYEKLMHGVK